MKKLLFIVILFLVTCKLTYALQNPRVGFDAGCGATICENQILKVTFLTDNFSNDCASYSSHPCFYLVWFVTPPSGPTQKIFMTLQDYCQNYPNGFPILTTGPGTYCVTGGHVLFDYPQPCDPNLIQQSWFTQAPCCVTLTDGDPQLSSDKSSYCTGDWVTINASAFNMQSNKMINWGDGTPLEANATQHQYTTAGTYTITFTGTSECGFVSKSITITVADCPVDCSNDFSISYSVYNCNIYTFDIFVNPQRYLNIPAFTWTLDGVFGSDNSQLIKTLTPGTHTICLTIFVSPENDKSLVTCCTKCVTVTVNSANSVTLLNLEYCPLGGNNTVSFDPCNDQNNFDHYIITGNGMYYNSNGNCITHQLTAGVYDLTYYDANGCPAKIVQVNVSPKIPQTQACFRNFILNCGDPFPNLDQLDVPCPGCMMAPGPNVIVGPWTSIQISSNTIQYSRLTSDLLNCTECMLVVEVTNNCQSPNPGNPSDNDKRYQDDMGTTFKLVPNPSSELFQIKSIINDGIVAFESVSIYDAKGTVVSEYKNVNTDTKFSLDGASKGTYYVKFIQGGKEQSLKLTLQ